MENKNNRLIKENNALKAMISQKDQAQEDILKRTVKAEYSQILSYKEMLKTIESSIQVLEQSVSECKKIQETMLKNRRKLSDSTNLLKNENFRMKDNSFEDSQRFQLKPKDRRKKEIIEENDIIQINDTGKTKGPRKRAEKRIEENLFNK
jgi:hypothetical protein